MEFEVYCDESGLEALTRKDAHLYSGIGGVWIPAEYRAEMKAAIAAIKVKHNVYGELKWSKVSPRFAPVYMELVDFFFSTPHIRFRVIIIESTKVDHIQFNNQDAELGFYKFYYQLLHHWIFDFNQYEIFIDLKVNRDKGRLKKLQEVLRNANLTSAVHQVQGLPSEESVGIQMADVLTGLVVSKFNREVKGAAKSQLIEHVENNHLKRKIASTPKWDEKFNVFKINLKGGW